MPKKALRTETGGGTSQFSLSAIRFLETLRIPEGPLAGQKIKLARFQRRFIEGAFADGVSIGALSVGRGSGKTMLGAGLCLGMLLGRIDPQPRREIVVAAKVRDQGMVAFRYIEGLAASLPIKVRKQLTFVKAPRLEVRYEGDGGGHALRVLASDARNALGLAPVFALLDERGHWHPDRGDQLESAILSALGKRAGRAAIISTSAPTDTHSFSRLLDDPGDGVFVQEHRANDGCDPDDPAALLAANPGLKEGLGSLSWLQAQAKRAVLRGGNTLASFRLFHLNQRTSDETRSVLIEVPRWLACEVSDLPERKGPLICGIDLGGSASMSAWANYWPETGRLECYGAFASQPGLLERGRADAVQDRYCEMQRRGELITLGANVVPVHEFVAAMLAKLEGYPVTTLVCDRFRQAELLDSLAKAGVRIVPTFRGMGWRDGAADVEAARAAIFDGKVSVLPSLLLRSAFGDAITVSDMAGNAKIAKGRSNGRIDAACAVVLAVSEGARRAARPVKQARPMQWA